MVEVPHDSPEYRATVAFRQRWLRHPLGLRFTDEELAAECDSIHLACYLGDELVGCAVLKSVAPGEMKMRQVVVHPDRQRRGLGAALVRRCEELARDLGYRQITLHARETAVRFYERLGYCREGDRFLEVGISHWRMTKDIVERSTL